MNDNQTPSSDESAELVKSTSNKVEVSADLLNEAVTQLRKLTELRQRESERQERAIAQMHTALKRQGVLSRYVVICCLIVVVISAALVYLMRQSAQHEITTANSIVEVDQRIDAASQTIAEATQKQVSSLDGVRSEVIATRDEQLRVSQSLETELQATRQTQASVIQKVEEQLGAVRQERDEVRGEVRAVLEEKTQQFTEREIQLRAEREAIKEAKIRSKEEQKALIQQTIERLNAMTATLSTEETAPETTDAEIDAVVEHVEAVEAAIVEDVQAEESTPIVVEDAAPAEAEVPVSP